MRNLEDLKNFEEETILIIDKMKCNLKWLDNIFNKTLEISKHCEDKEIMSNGKDEFITNKYLTKLIVV